MSKFGWDLPPGVTTSMLPGNSPAEQEEEAFADTVYEMLGEGVDETLAEKVYKWASELRGAAYSEGYNAGQLDEQQASEVKIEELEMKLRKIFDLSRTALD